MEVEKKFKPASVEDSTFQPVELGELGEAEKLDTFFQSIERGDTEVALPDVFKTELLAGREAAERLTLDVPEKGFRIFESDSRWYKDREYLVGGRAMSIDFRDFHVPDRYTQRAHIHFHPFCRFEDGSERSNFLSPGDIASIVCNIGDRHCVVEGAIGKDFFVIAVGTEETRQKILKTISWKYVPQTVHGYADNTLHMFDHLPEVRGFGEAAKQMNLFVADDLRLNMYYWDYQGKALMNSKEYKERVPFDYNFWHD